MNMHRLHPLLPWLLSSLTLLGTSAVQADESISAFFGRYEGTAVTEGKADLPPRDTTVEIYRARKRGFVVEWTTVTRRANGTLKRKAYKVTFRPSSTDNVYASAMRTNVFGKAIPLDPLQGDPYMWATIADRTLTVYAMLITENFGYEMQTYARTLIDNGMELLFTRVRDGAVLKEIRGTLRRVD